ncbi:MAG: EF-hand domain-containing protein [Planctomycetota bacterium]|jgi:Ca2+-binding EF-hand superfamily protein
MKSLVLVALCLALVLPAAPAVAEDEAPPATSRFFETYDRNGDGQVTQDEFQGDGEIFRLLDKDEDGVITPTDLGLPTDYRPERARPGTPAPGAGPGASPNRPGPQGADRAAAMRRRLEAMDRNGDGRIGRDEFRGPDEVFGRLDRDGNGTIDAADLEALAAGQPGQPGQGQPGRQRPGRPRPAPTPEQDAMRFRGMDKDGDGKLVADEFPRPEVFARVDADQDGFVTLEEYQAAVAQYRRQGQRQRQRQQGRRGGGLTEQAFRRFDQDRDGQVTRDEFPGSDERFDQLDVNGDGLLTDADRRPAPDAAPTDRAPATPTPRGPVDASDEDGDGKLSRDEFEGSDEEWRRLDANGDGWITKDETGEDRGPDLAAIVARDDVDGDGRVSRREFTGTAEAFDALDRTRDGVLDAQDAR